MSCSRPRCSSQNGGDTSTYSNEPNFINNALLVAKEYFHFKLSNVIKRATVACAQCASHTEAHCSASLSAWRFGTAHCSASLLVYYFVKL